MEMNGLKKEINQERELNLSFAKKLTDNSGGNPLQESVGQQSQYSNDFKPSNDTYQGSSIQEILNKPLANLFQSNLLLISQLELYIYNRYYPNSMEFCSHALVKLKKLIKKNYGSYTYKDLLNFPRCELGDFLNNLRINPQFNPNEMLSKQNSLEISPQEAEYMITFLQQLAKLI